MAERSEDAAPDGVLDELKQLLRQARHNPCLMRPATAALLLVFAIVYAVTALFKLPLFLLSRVLQPILRKFLWVIEFIYPTALGRWVHISLVKMLMSKTSKGLCHSRTLEMRIQVVKDRVYIHPLPQLLDNLGYLVVCLPKKSATAAEEDVHAPILGFIVDCGDAESVLEQIEAISKLHYANQTIHVQSIFSTHKHHDHTAGNLAFQKAHSSLQFICGGAVERVPGCTVPLANGDLLPLPKHALNDMADLVHVEAIATPAHTRGSLLFALRVLDTARGCNGGAFLFTGDTIFSGGSGVPFEADSDTQEESKLQPTSFIQASGGAYAIERCFAEVLTRCSTTLSSKDILILPGHEYSNELLSRQLMQSTESCRWKNMAPSAFFETASQFYVAAHRRSLPNSTGKLLAAPSSLRRELLINPQFRSLKKRGDVVVKAIEHWNQHFAKNKVPERYADESAGMRQSIPRLGSEDTLEEQAVRSMYTQWTLDQRIIDQPVFTTVYNSDFNFIIAQLKNEDIQGKAAALKLEQMKTILAVPTINRRPIPETLPSDRTISRGVLGLLLLGSAPAAMTISDARTMKLPPPVVSSSDRTRVSKSRLISVLYGLGLLDDEFDGHRIISMIHEVWNEASAFADQLSCADLIFKEDESADSEKVTSNIRTRKSSAATPSKATDIESKADVDEVELGDLKWVLYGIPKRRPSSWGKYCLPCSSNDTPHPLHSTEESGMHQHAGELVRHDPFTCLLCTSATGGPMEAASSSAESMNEGTEHPLNLHRAMSVPEDPPEIMQVDGGAIGALLREA
jgi:glyoxylase-like metal-dependent hydrolase (beta-lactamase superfamily II)